jgi:hypothetical protein
MSTFSSTTTKKSEFPLVDPACRAVPRTSRSASGIYLMFWRVGVFLASAAGRILNSGKSRWGLSDSGLRVILDILAFPEFLGVGCQVDCQGKTSRFQNNPVEVDIHRQSEELPG